jgi:hypothetical protein
MRDKPTKEGRPPEIAEPTDADLPQDPGIPGSKVTEEQETDWSPSTPGRGFPESARDES